MESILDSLFMFGLDSYLVLDLREVDKQKLSFQEDMRDKLFVWFDHWKPWPPRGFGYLVGPKKEFQNILYNDRESTFGRYQLPCELLATTAPYASFLAFPRVLVQEMSRPWLSSMAELVSVLYEASATRYQVEYFVWKGGKREFPYRAFGVDPLEDYQHPYVDFVRSLLR